MPPYISADLAWLGVDRAGHVAVFTTACMGPIPAAVAAHPERIDRAEGAVYQLPSVGGCKFLVTLNRPDDYEECACRGFYAYDVDAGHGAGFDYRYEIIAQPSVPRSIHEIGDELAALASLARFDTLVFADSPSIPVHELVPCVHPPRWSAPRSRWAWLWCR